MKAENVTIININGKKAIKFSWNQFYYNGTRSEFVEWYSKFLSAALLVNDFDLSLNGTITRNNKKMRVNKTVLKLDENSSSPITIFVLFEGSTNNKFNRIFHMPKYSNLMKFLIQFYFLYDSKYIENGQLNAYKNLKEVVYAIYSETKEGSHPLDMKKFVELLCKQYPKLIDITFPIFSDLDDDEILQGLTLATNNLSSKLKLLNKKYLGDAGDALNDYEDLGVLDYVSQRNRQRDIQNLTNAIDEIYARPTTSSRLDEIDEQIADIEHQIQQLLNDNLNNAPYDDVFAKGLSKYHNLKK